MCRTFALTLLITLVVSSAACARLMPAPQSGPQCVAIRPTGLDFQWRDGGVWMREDDLASLLIYIEQLKRCAAA